LSIVVKSGVVGLLAVSLFAVSRGLAASPAIPEGSSPTVQARPAETELPPPTPVAPSPTIEAAAIAPASTVHTVITPEALGRMVAFRAAHPRPLGPDTECLAKTVYLEAANQTLWGQLAVAQVIVNRMNSSTYPKSACAVVEQPKQFADQSTGPDDQSGKSWNAAVAIARIAQDGRVTQVVPGALFFHASYVSPSWSQSRERIAQIGDHIFYR